MTRRRGADVVIGFVETRGRARTAEQIGGGVAMVVSLPEAAA